MAKYEQKMKPSTEDVDALLADLEDDGKRADAIRLRTIMEEISGQPARDWGYGMLGFGAYHYRYESGHEGDAPAVAFAPRKANFTLYITGGFEEHQDTLARLGKHKLGKGCLYIKRLSDVDETVLRELVQASLDNAERFHVEA